MDNEVLQRVKTAIHNSEKLIKELEQDIRKAERAGVDVTTPRQMLEQRYRDIFKLKQVYGI